MKKNLCILLIIALMLSSVAYATGGPGMLSNNAEMFGAQNIASDVTVTNNENITSIDMSMYEQLSIVDYSSCHIYIDGVNSSNQHITKGISVNIPIVTGYNSEKINQVLGKSMSKYVQSILRENWDFSNEKPSKLESFGVINDSATFKLGNGYIVFKLTTHGKINIAIKYDLASDTLSVVK